MVFCKVLSISLTFYGEGLWQGFKFSCETTDNWTYFVRILKIIGLITWWVFSYKDDLFTLKSLNTLRWLMNVYVEVRSVYLLNRFLMIKTYLNKNQMSDFSVLLPKQGVDSFFENVYIFFILHQRITRQWLNWGKRSCVDV